MNLLAWLFYRPEWSERRRIALRQRCGDVSIPVPRWHYSGAMETVRYVCERPFAHAGAHGLNDKTAEWWSMDAH